jgi:signal transduction histidine kinase/ligand-binding sensor domain-containing protein
LNVGNYNCVKPLLYLVVLAGIWPAACVYCQHQPVRFEHCSLRQGLSQGSGYAITQDHHGYIWMGTQHGLNRFDGHTISVYYNGDKGYSGSNFINHLLTDSAGNVWIASTGGLSVLENASRQFMTVSRLTQQKTALDSIAILQLWQDSKYRVWASSTVSGVFRVTHKNGSWQIAQFLGQGPYRGGAITEDKTGRIWLSSQQDIFYYDEQAGRFELCYVKGISGQKDIRAILVDADNLLWVATFDDGIYIISPDIREPAIVRHLCKAAPGKSSLGSNDITSVLKDSDNNIWIGTRNDGLSKYIHQTGEIIQVRHDDEIPESLSKNFVLSLYEDNQKNIWVGTSGGGFDRYDPKKSHFELFRHTGGRSNDVGDNMIFFIKRLPPGYMYFGTQSAGLARWNQEKNAFTRFTKNPDNPNSLVHNTVYDVVADDAGRLWIATWGGLCSYDESLPPGKRYSRYNNERSQVSRLYSLHKLKNENKLWVSGDNGTFIFDISTRQWLDWPDEEMSRLIGTQCIRVFYEDDAGNTWMGSTDNGIIRYNRQSGKLSVIPVAAPSVRSVVRSLRPDGDQYLRAGTDNGWLKLDIANEEIAERFTTTDGLPDNVVYSMEKDRDGNWWISTNRGLACYMVKQKTFRVYDERDGLQSNEFNTNCSWTDSSGIMYFGGVNGFNVFDPLRFKPGSYAADVRLTAIRLFDSTWLSDLEADRVQELRLKHFQNFVSFEFVALDYSFSDKATYYYMMEGLDKTWMSSGSRRYVSYTGLQPGEYTFKVIYQNRDGIYSKNTASIKIIISPPWWLTWWALGLYVIAIVGVAYGLYRRRINQLKKKQAEQIKTMVATQEDERERLSRDLHDDVGTRLSAIKLYISSLGKKIDERQLDEARKLAENSERLIDETMGDVRKMLLNLSPQVLEEFGYATAVEVLVNKINETRLLNFDLVMFGLKQGLPKDHELVLYRITQELINNVLKHAGASRVSLQVGHRDEKIILMIEDNGKGFDIKEHKNGYGLKNLEARTQLLKGQMEIDSKPGKGTCVLIEIPYKMNDHARV